MSHFVKLGQAIIKDKSAFIKACEEEGLEIHARDGGTIRGWQNRTVNVAAGARLRGSEAGIGLVDNGDGSYQIQADSMYFRQSMIDRIVQNTTKHAIIDRYARKGYRASTETDAEGNVKLRLQSA